MWLWNCNFEIKLSGFLKQWHRKTNISIFHVQCTLQTLLSVQDPIFPSVSEIYLCFSKLFLWLQTVFCTCISILPATTKTQRPNGNCTDWSSEDFRVHCIKAYGKQYLWHLYQFNAEYSRWNSCASKQQFSKMRFIQAPTHTYTKRRYQRWKRK